MSTPIDMHEARTALNNDMKLRQWAEQWLKFKEREAEHSMTDEEFEQYWLQVRPERLHERAVEAVTVYRERVEGQP
jgi:hypothetical protein